MTALFKWLYDGLPEDGLEECAFLRCDLAATAAEAVAVMTKLYEEDVGPLSDYGEGIAFGGEPTRVWLRAELQMYDDDGEETGKFVGSKAEEFAAYHSRDDEVRYPPCEPTDEGAIEWWRVELVLPEDAIQQETP